MKIAIATAAFFGTAIVGLLEATGYDYAPSMGYADGSEAFVLVNTDKKTFKDSDTDGGRPTYQPTTQWEAIVAAVSAATPAATPAAAIAPAASAAPATSGGLVIGDQVRATNGSKTKAKFRLDTNRVYTVARITAKGNVGLEGLPNDEYLVKRFTKVATTTGGTAAPYAAASAVVSTPAPAAPAPVRAVDAVGNTLAVGDTVVVKVANPGRRDRKFVLTADKVETITVITAKGNIGFGGADQYKPNRFQKVTLSDAAGNVRSGDKVVNVKARRDGRFALPLNTLLTFRGLTVDGGKFILDGYTVDQYAPSRFKKVTLVG